VVRPGSLVRKGDQIVSAASTITLVTAGLRKIIVDTGAPGEEDALRKRFEEMGVTTDSIDTVVSTHLHIDHCGCNDIFENATFVAHRLEDPPVGTIRLAGETTLATGIVVLPTPGHTAGSVSVLVEAERRYAISGDAIPTRSDYEQHVPPFIHSDRALAVKSMDILLEWADVVVPGHDSVFEVVRKK